MLTTQRCLLRASSNVFRIARRSGDNGGTKQTWRSKDGNAQRPANVKFGVRNAGRSPLPTIDLHQRREDDLKHMNVVRDKQKSLSHLGQRSGGALLHGTTLDPQSENGIRPRYLSEIRPGDLVEVQGAGRSRIGITLAYTAADGAGDLSQGTGIKSYALLQVSGEIDFIRPTDVHFFIPSFVSTQDAIDAQQLMVRVSEEQMKNTPGLRLVSSSTSEIVVEEFDEKRFKVRAEICEKLRVLLWATERCRRKFTPAFESRFLADQSAAADLDSTVTIDEMAYQLARDSGADDAEAKRLTKEPSVLFATHQLLRSSPDVLRLDDVSHRSTNMFTILSRAKQSMVKAVRAMVQTSLKDLSRSDTLDETANEIQAFSSRVRKVVQERKAAMQRHFGAEKVDLGPQTFEDTSLQTVGWTKEDRTILQFLRMVLHSRRALSYEAMYEPALHILSECGYNYEEKVLMFNSDLNIVSSMATARKQLIVNLFQDLGLLTPWDDVTTLDSEFHDRFELSQSRIPASDVVDDDEAIRRDVYERVYVIDDEGSAELDDGISVKPTSDPNKSWISVHIADPTKGVQVGDAVAEDARRKQMSIYTPEANWSMLPKDIVDRFGLRPPSPSSLSTPFRHHAMTFSGKVDHTTGVVSEIDVGLSYLHDVRVINYDDAAAEIEGRKSTDIKSETDLRQLQQAALALVRRRRVDEGAIIGFTDPTRGKISLSPLPLAPSILRSKEFASETGDVNTRQLHAGFPKVSYTTFDNLKDNDVDAAAAAQANAQEGAAQVVVSEMAILAGRVAGRFLKERNVPALYRIQRSPKDDETYGRILALRNERGYASLTDFAFNELQFDPSTTTHFASEQFFMGVLTRTGRQTQGEGGLRDDLLVNAGYSRVTSPLRRYTDMMMHWQIRHTLKQASGKTMTNDAAPFSREDLMKELPNLLRMEQWHSTQERYASRFWMLKRLHHAHVARMQPEVHQDDDVFANRFLDATHEAAVDDDTCRMINLVPHVRMTLLASRIQVLCVWPTSFSTIDRLANKFDQSKTNQIDLHQREAWRNPKIGQRFNVCITDVRPDMNSTSISAKLVHS